MAVLPFGKEAFATVRSDRGRFSQKRKLYPYSKWPISFAFANETRPKKTPAPFRKERSLGEIALRFADRCKKRCKPRRPERGIRPKNGPMKWPRWSFPVCS